MHATIQNAPDRIHTDGTRAGDPIPGSKLYRCFCPKCGDAIRFKAASPADAMRRVGGKAKVERGTADGVEHRDSSRFTPFCQECVDDGPQPESIVSVDDLFRISNNRDPVSLPYGELKLSARASVRLATRMLCTGQSTRSS